MDYDNTAMPGIYDAGRGYTPAVMEFWLRTISSAVPKANINAILDLGCGTGRYSSALAAHFGARVVAVDPSKKMLAEARKKAADNVTFMSGSGEMVPLAEATVDMVFMSMVFHHFSQPEKAAKECHRVLRDGGVVCLRAGVTDRIDSYPYLPFFPMVPALLAKSLGSLAFIEATFVTAGFTLTHHEVVMSKTATSCRAYADKTAYRADSILAQLTDREFEDGMSALHEHASTMPSDQPVVEPVDFFVFRRS
jgi:ubiquinone/menaquinone biosynthesis C-methylase UbiE